MKKKTKPPVRTGTWLDQQSAFIIRIDGQEEPVMEKIKSDVESRVRIAGEGRVYARFGQAFLDDQEKKQRRQGHQRRRYFKEIISRLQDADAIALFGPGKAKQELMNQLEKDPVLKDKVMAVEAADRITKSQMMMLVKNFFEKYPLKGFRKKTSSVKIAK